jgi:hypothetical protein
MPRLPYKNLLIYSTTPQFNFGHGGQIGFRIIGKFDHFVAATGYL